ncbi:hypothetical protein JCM8202_000718 [Rhodotorula sphaerocarpa]
MPPPTIHDDDLDDLDDVLDSFATPTASTSKVPAPAPAASTAPAPSPPRPKVDSTPAAAAQDDSFSDPDDAELDSFLDPDMARELEQGMQALLANLGQGQAGASSGDGAAAGFDDAEFSKMMQEMLKGDLGGFGGGGAGEAGPGGPGGAGGGVGDEAELRKLMAALGMSEQDLERPADFGRSGPSASTARPAPAAATAKPAASTSAPTPAAAPAAPANFQDAIAASMSKLRDSSSTADASRAASSAGPGAAGGGDAAGTAAMLAQLAGLPGGAAGLEGLDSDEGLQGMLDDMMKQLMSREMLYEPLKELADKYPPYLSAHGASLSSTDRDRFEKQRVIVCEIVAAFEEPGADHDPEAKLSAEEEQKRAERTERVVELVAKMNECGAPPSEIMGEMPPGMELGPDGAPKIPECCVS